MEWDRRGDGKRRRWVLEMLGSSVLVLWDGRYPVRNIKSETNKTGYRVAIYPLFILVFISRE
jgi:hypothetical protein